MKIRVTKDIVINDLELLFREGQQVNVIRFDSNQNADITGALVGIWLRPDEFEIIEDEEIT